MSAITFDQGTKASMRDWLRDTWVFAGRNAQHIRRLSLRRHPCRCHAKQHTRQNAQPKGKPDHF